MAANRQTNRQLPTAENHSGRGNVHTDLTEINIQTQGRSNKIYQAGDAYIYFMSETICLSLEQTMAFRLEEGGVDGEIY